MPTRRTTVGKILLKRILPEEYHPFLEQGPLNSSRMQELMQDLTVKYPGEYRDILQRLNDLGESVSKSYGGEASLTPESFLSSPKLSKARVALQARLSDIRNGPLPVEEKDSQTIEELQNFRENVEDLVVDSIKGTSLGIQLESGTRGNIGQITDLLVGELLPIDSQGDPLPLPITRGYAEGLTPSQYWGAAQRARQGLIGVKLATPVAGDISNQLINAVNRLRITQEKEPEGTRVGLPVDASDPDYIGSVLARDVPGIARAGQRLTPRMERKMREQDVGTILIHSPITSRAEHGISRESAGTALGELPAVGDFYGISAAQSLSEPFVQVNIGCIAEGTKVLMGNWSWEKIEDIEPGDVVMGCSLGGQMQPTEVLHTFDNGLTECVRVEFQLGEETLVFEGTGNHGILSDYVNSDSGDGTIAVRRVDTMERQRGDRFCAWIPEEYGPGPTVAPATSCHSLGRRRVHDLHVKHPSHLFMLNNGLVVANSKHTGQRASAGLEAVQSLIEAPYHFPGAAPVAEKPGTVQDIRELPTGARQITIGQSQYIVPPGAELQVKEGSRVGTGDVLSSGLPDPRKLVELLGIGAGRKAYAGVLSDTLRRSGVDHNKRNVEYLARGLVNHVRMNQPYGEWLPGDVVEFSEIDRRYSPREGYREAAPGKSAGAYLEEPVAHLTVGTRLTPGMTRQLKDLGYGRVKVHDKPPPFEPEMRRARESTQHAPDWLTRLSGSNLKRSTMDALYSGNAPSDPTEPTALHAQMLLEGAPIELKSF